MKRQCAWCNVEAGRDQGNGSHGICKRHAALVRQAQQARKQQKAASTAAKG